MKASETVREGEEGERGKEDERETESEREGKSSFHRPQVPDKVQTPSFEDFIQRDDMYLPGTVLQDV